MTAVTGRSRRGADAVDRFDGAIDRMFDHLRGRPAVDRVFYGASAVGDHSVVWLALATLRGLRSDDSWHGVVRAAAGIGAESLLVNGPVKWVFRRARPVDDRIRPLPLRRPRTSSFPSGHATSAFCAAALLSDGDPDMRPLYYALALVVAWSRVYVRVHHASDVVGGMVIGALLGRAGRSLFPLPAAEGPRPYPGGAESRGDRSG